MYSREICQTILPQGKWASKGKAIMEHKNKKQQNVSTTQKSVRSAPSSKNRMMTRAAYSGQVRNEAFIFNRSARAVKCREVDEATWEQTAMQVLDEYDGAWKRLADL